MAIEMNKESTIELTEALSEMFRNSHIGDEVVPTTLAVFLYCPNCDDFHLFTYKSEELLEAAGIVGMLSAMLSNDDAVSGENIVISACKAIGSQLAARNKEVLAVSLLASGGEVEIDKEVEANKTDEEVREIIKRAMVEGDERVRINPNISITTLARPDIYYSIFYSVEMVSDGDVLMTNKREEDDGDRSSVFKIHHTLLNSARFLSSVANYKIKTCEDKDETVLSGDNEVKFHSITARIEASLKVEDIT